MHVKKRKAFVVVLLVYYPLQALMRPGRFDRVLYVPLPDMSTRSQIFRIKLRQMPVADSVEIQWLAKATEGYSGAEVSSPLRLLILNMKCFAEFILLF